MGGVKVVNLGCRGETPGGICESIPPDDLCQPENVAPAGVTLCPVYHPLGWGPLCAIVGGIKGLICPGPNMGR